MIIYTFFKKYIVNKITKNLQTYYFLKNFDNHMHSIFFKIYTPIKNILYANIILF